MDSDDTYRLDLGLAPRERSHFADTPQEATTTSRRANPRVRSLDEASLAGLSGVPLPRPPLKLPGWTLPLPINPTDCRLILNGESEKSEVGLGCCVWELHRRRFR